VAPGSRFGSGAFSLILALKLRIGHPANPGHKRCEGAYDRQKPRQDNRLGAIFLVKLMRSLQVPWI
jgi:hypothetical protein